MGAGGGAFWPKQSPRGSKEMLQEGHGCYRMGARESQRGTWAESWHDGNSATVMPGWPVTTVSAIH